MQWCRTSGAKITSNSWGGGGFSSSLYNEMVTAQNAGMLFIAAAGNDNRNTDVTPNYPSVRVGWLVGWLVWGAGGRMLICWLVTFKTAASKP